MRSIFCKNINKKLKTMEVICRMYRTMIDFLKSGNTKDKLCYMEIRMNKQEFLKIFRTALSGQVPAYIIEENVRYYDEYIEMQIRQGKREQDVLSELGDPRLLAKTVITTNKSAETAQESTRQTYEGSGYEGQAYNASHKSGGFLEWFFKLPSWLRSILTVIVLVGVFFLLAKIVGLILPFVLLFAIVVYIVKMFKGR